MAGRASQGLLICCALAALALYFGVSTSSQSNSPSISPIFRNVNSQKWPRTLNPIPLLTDFAGFWSNEIHLFGFLTSRCGNWGCDAQHVTIGDAADHAKGRPEA
eukprot:1375445-Amorphochlora_amoeboformis.AAC.1